MLSTVTTRFKGVHRKGKPADVQRKEIALMSSGIPKPVTFGALTMAIPLMLGACQSAQTSTEIIPAEGPYDTVECDTLEGRYRVLDTAIEGFFEQNENRDLAFILTYGIDGEITRWRIEDAECLPIEDDLPLKVLRRLEPVALFVIEHDGNTHICAGDQSGGSGGSVCPKH